MERTLASENLHDKELSYNTFEVLMQEVDAGARTFDEAIAEFQRRELSPKLTSELSAVALQAE